MRMTIVMFAALGLVTSACGKKTPPPEPTKAAEADAAAPAKEDVAAAPAKEDVAVAAADTAAAPAPDAAAPAPDAAVAAADAAAPAPARVFKDRAEWTTSVLDSFAAGKYDEAFTELADDATWFDLGNPMAAEVKGKAAIIEHHKANAAGWSEVKFKASRVIDAGEYVAVEATWTAKNTAELMGKPATDKVATVPGAFVLHFVDGKVDKVWNVFDFSIAMTQVGMMPGEAQAPTMPDAVELVTGPMSAANAEVYKPNTEKLGPDTVEAVMKGYCAEDMVQVDGFTGKTITGLTENVAYMQGMMKAMGDFKIAVDNVWGAGDWLFAAQTVSFTYKGGMGDIPAKDQKVAMPVLAFAKFADGKIKWYRDYANGLGMLGQLGVDLGLGGAAPKPDGAAPAEGTFGIASCDLYIAKMKECLGKAAGPVAEAAQKALDEGMKGWKETLTAQGEAAKAPIEAACKGALEGAKNMAMMCPDVKWE